MAYQNPKNPPPIIALKGADLAFGDKSLFKHVDIAVGRGDKICLVGRNGSGKTTLMRALAGEIELDKGDRFVQPNIQIGFMPQAPNMPIGVDIQSHVKSAIPKQNSKYSDEIQVASILINLGLEGNRLLNTLSGGETRRVVLARALVSRPDVLLLDEPTNHLDLPTVEWLEGELSKYRGGLLVISHDRTFLRNLSNKTYWIDRTIVRRLSAGFSQFSDWAEKVLEVEETRNHQLNQQIVRETRWLREGLTARRKRNTGRIRKLLTLRKEKSEQLKNPTQTELSLKQTIRSGELVLEASAIFKNFVGDDGREAIIVRDFSTIVRRQDRIGLIGKNGVGKTTLLRTLIGDLTPDKGRVRIGQGVEIVYFDQKRETLNELITPWKFLCPGGGDTVEFGGKSLHVISYLRYFLFEEKQAKSPIGALSGGEKNRLLLAYLFCQNHNLLIMDEPTNDLDIETLELLEEVLSEYDGTIIVVSHDRDFLDKIVTSIICMEEDGRITEHVGGFNDYLVQRVATNASIPKPVKKKKSYVTKSYSPKANIKLSYQDERELQKLPAEILNLESEIDDLRQILSDVDLFKRDPKYFVSTTDRLTAATERLNNAENRWLDLELLREQLSTRKT